MAAQTIEDMDMKTLALALLAALAGPAANAHIEAAHAAAHAINARWEQAFDAGDAPALAALYTTDAIVVSPGLEIVNRVEEIEKFWAEKIASGTRDFRVRPINLRTDGDRVYQTAAWSAALMVEGRLNRFDGEMTTVLERQTDDSWKIRLQHWH
jgi:uncharacterized protein (TIGR02246 family)